LTIVPRRAVGSDERLAQLPDAHHRTGVRAAHSRDVERKVLSTLKDGAIAVRCWRDSGRAFREMSIN
jgi:hypothetical protein